MTGLAVNSQTLTAKTAMITLAGGMDAGNFETLEDELSKVLESGVIGLVLDVSGLDALSSAGLGAILNMSQILEGKKGKLILAAPQPKVLGTLEMLGLQETLAISDSVDAAKKKVSALKV